jgi:hypothetical protein
LSLAGVHPSSRRPLGRLARSRRNYYVTPFVSSAGKGLPAVLRTVNWTRKLRLRDLRPAAVRPKKPGRSGHRHKGLHLPPSRLCAARPVLLSLAACELLPLAAADNQPSPGLQSRQGSCSCIHHQSKGAHRRPSPASLPKPRAQAASRRRRRRSGPLTRQAHGAIEPEAMGERHCCCPGVLDLQAEVLAPSRASSTSSGKV